MDFFWLALTAAAAYLLGSVNFAVLVTRARTGKDIRELGNRNPGTANVGRTLGRGWGALILLLDVLKSLLPMLAVRFFLFPGSETYSALGVYVTGLAAITGHCRPAFFGFHGGGGVATALPVFFFFTPIEFSASLLVSGLVVLFLLRRVAFRVGRWLPMIALSFVPFLVLGANQLVTVRLTDWLGIGGRPWSVPAGVFTTTLMIHGFNLRLTVGTLRRPFEKVERS